MPETARKTTRHRVAAWRSGLFGLALLLSVGCGLLPSPSPTVTSTPTPSLTPTATATVTHTPTSTTTFTPRPTATSTHTATPSPTLTATPEFPPVTVTIQANCRYGPGTAYLYRWALYPGDQADVRGRNWDGSWLWIHPANLPDANCWASKIVFAETVENSQAPVVDIPLPHTSFAGPPGNVQAARDGEQVTVTWNDVPLSEDKRRGYLIEANTCRNGLLLPIIIHTDGSSYTFEDQPGCAQPSNGLLYTAEKHGYSDPVSIPWP
jgi:hypothetical protein